MKDTSEAAGTCGKPSSAGLPPGAFAVGYHAIHPDTGINYQMNRFAIGRPDMVAEMKAVAPRIHDYTDYVREFLALSEEAMSNGRALESAYYLRSAEFFMFPDDPRKPAARAKFVNLMKEQFQIPEETHHCVPYGSASLSAYRFTHPEARGTIVFYGGYDSYIEELFAFLLYLRDAGFDVISFEGPGQGTALEEDDLSMTPHWEKPVGAVLDHFGLDDVTLIGYSLGGCLAIRAAAREPRVTRVVLDDIYTSLLDVSFHQTSMGVRTALRTLLWLRVVPLVNLLTFWGMKRRLDVEWAVRQGMHVLGAASPWQYYQQAALYRTKDLSPFVKQDVLVLAGAEDHYVPVHQFYDQIRWLTRARSITARLFTRSQQAQNHNHVGNLGLSLRLIVEWIAERQLSRGNAV